jgi:hypothetical protein
MKPRNEGEILVVPIIVITSVLWFVLIVLNTISVSVFHIFVPSASLVGTALYLLVTNSIFLLLIAKSILKLLEVLDDE